MSLNREGWPRTDVEVKRLKYWMKKKADEGSADADNKTKKGESRGKRLVCVCAWKLWFWVKLDAFYEKLEPKRMNGTESDASRPWSIHALPIVGARTITHDRIWLRRTRNASELVQVELMVIDLEPYTTRPFVLKLGQSNPSNILTNVVDSDISHVQAIPTSLRGGGGSTAIVLHSIPLDLSFEEKNSGFWEYLHSPRKKDTHKPYPIHWVNKTKKRKGMIRKQWMNFPACALIISSGLSHWFILYDNSSRLDKG